MDFNSILEGLVLTLPELKSQHSPDMKVYGFLKQIARKEIENMFAAKRPDGFDFAPFGEIVFPYHKMGAIDSMNLFDIDEIIIFSFYWINRDRYKRVLDIGANLGLHSILLSKCGYEVKSYEPDPTHFKILKKNLDLNHCAKVQAFNEAVSDRSGEMEFTRVLGNTTSSHLSGSKANPYGDLEKFPVRVEAVNNLIGWADLIKLDAEGHEKEILKSTKRSDWINTDALIEVENGNNAEVIYEHFKKIDVRLFSQKKNWREVEKLEDVPTSYREGTLFLTCKSEMPW